jgi:hypothetical protein
MAHPRAVAAADGDRLEEILASMPLRVWPALSCYISWSQACHNKLLALPP